MHYDLILIGFGMASARLLQELCQKPQRPPRILVIGEEPQPAYNRVQLPALLAGEQQAADLQLLSTDWLSEQRIHWLFADPVSTVERAAKRLYCASGQCFSYSQLVFCTGASALMPDPSRLATELTQPLRTLADADRLQHYPAGSELVILGAGFIGLEIAAALSQRYLVSLVHRNAYPLNRQLDPAAGLWLTQQLEQMGIRCLMSQQVQQSRRLPSGRIELQLNQTTVQTDIVVSTLGISPRIDLARQAGLDTAAGIRVNAQLRSSDPDIFALGECCELNGQTFGLVAPAYQQAKVLAAVLTGEFQTYQPQANLTHLKVNGLSLCSCGDIAALLQQGQTPAGPDASQHHSLSYQDPGTGDYRRLWFANDQLQGAVLCGDTSQAAFYQQVMHKTGQQPDAKLLFQSL